MERHYVLFFISCLAPNFGNFYYLVNNQYYAKTYGTYEL